MLKTCCLPPVHTMVLLPTDRYWGFVRSGSCLIIRRTHRPMLALYQFVYCDIRRLKWRRNTMSKKLDGKIALITGGSRGIGAGIAKRLAAEGAVVAITYTKGSDAAAAVVKNIESTGGRAIAIQADAADADAVKAAVEKTVADLGRLDVLVNNA